MSTAVHREFIQQSPTTYNLYNLGRSGHSTMWICISSKYFWNSGGHPMMSSTYIIGNYLWGGKLALKRQHFQHYFTNASCKYTETKGKGAFKHVDVTRYGPRESHCKQPIPTWDIHWCGSSHHSSVITYFPNLPMLSHKEDGPQQTQPVKMSKASWWYCNEIMSPANQHWYQRGLQSLTTEKVPSCNQSPSRRIFIWGHNHQKHIFLLSKKMAALTLIHWRQDHVDPPMATDFICLENWFKMLPDNTSSFLVSFQMWWSFMTFSCWFEQQEKGSCCMHCPSRSKTLNLIVHIAIII